MGLRKGQCNNPKGRPRGAVNRLAKDVRLEIVEFLQGNWPEVVGLWKELEPKEKLKFYESLLPYAVAKMQSVAMEMDINRLSDAQVNSIIDELLKNEKK